LLVDGHANIIVAGSITVPSFATLSVLYPAPPLNVQDTIVAEASAITPTAPPLSLAVFPSKVHEVIVAAPLFTEIAPPIPALVPGGTHVPMKMQDVILAVPEKTHTAPP
jgi:hypothetical protein